MTNLTLAIDTATSETAVFIVRDTDVIYHLQNPTQRRADNLLELIDCALKEVGARLSDLRAILVRRGVGSYTGLRIGVTVANILAFSLDIPVGGIVSRRLSPILASSLIRRLKKWELGVRNGKFTTPIFPIYGTWSSPAASANLKQKK